MSILFFHQRLTVKFFTQRVSYRVSVGRKDRRHPGGVTRFMISRLEKGFKPAGTGPLSRVTGRDLNRLHLMLFKKIAIDFPFYPRDSKNQAI
ncbi:hypothetical protein HA42_01145 [Pantoea deleyi]|nr:hypothetical protein HA42_01145 [Pantoea deleyi]